MPQLYELKMQAEKIKLIVFSYIESKGLEKTKQCLKKAFLLPVEIHEPHVDISVFYDKNRGQYNANQILRMIDELFGEDNAKTIGLFNIDLFIPIFTYIFGQAHLGGKTAIVSKYRLSNERFGIKPDPVLHHQRFCKEIVHELGHTFGLKHCHTPTCVMRSATYTEDVDQKSNELCPKCRKDYEILISGQSSDNKF